MVYLIIIIFIAFINRLLFLFQPIRYDEAYSFLIFSMNPLSSALTNYMSRNNHLLHTFLSHIFFKLFGPTPEIIRLPAFIAGILIIWVNYIWVKKVYDENSALISSALLASSSILIEFSTSARGYTLMILFNIIALSSTYKLISTQFRRGYLWLIISSVLGLYTIPTFIYPFGICIAFLFFYIISEFRKGNKINIVRLLISLFAVGLLTALLYLPIFFRIKKDFNVTLFSLFIPSPFFILGKKITVLARESARQWVENIPFSAIIACNAIFLISFINKELRKRHLFLIMPVVVGYVSMLLLLRRPPDTTRHLLFLLPIYYALIAASLSWFFNIFIHYLNRKISFNISYILVLVLCLFLSLRVIDAYNKQPREFQSAQDIVLKLKPELRNADRVLSKCPADAPLAYYLYLYGMPSQYVAHDTLSAKRFFVVVLHRQNLKNVVNASLINGLEPVSNFTDASLYVSER